MAKLARILFVLKLLVAGTVASAATVRSVDEASLARRADIIGMGAVIQTRARISPTGRISTEAKVQIYRAVHGCAPGEILTLEVGGGSLPAGVSTEIDGAPKLLAGQLLFLFVERHGQRVRPLGQALGVMYVRKGSDGLYYARRDLAGLVLLNAAGQVASPDPRFTEEVALEGLVRRVEAHLTAGLAPLQRNEPRLRMTR